MKQRDWMIIARSTVWCFSCFLVVSGLTACRSENKQQAEVFYEAGRRYEADSMYSKAIAEYRKAVERYPDHRDAHFQIGKICEQLGLPFMARIGYEAALRVDDDFALAYNNLGNVLGQMGKLDSAVQMYEKAIDEDPTMASAHYNLGHAYLLKKELRKAEAELREAVRINAKEPRYQKGLGFFLMTVQRPEEAIGCLRQAEVMDTLDSEIPYHLSMLHESLGQYDEAISYTERYLPRITDQQERTITIRRLLDLKSRRAIGKLDAQRARIRKKPA